MQIQPSAPPPHLSESPESTAKTTIQGPVNDRPAPGQPQPALLDAAGYLARTTTQIQTIPSMLFGADTTTKQRLRLAEKRR